MNKQINNSEPLNNSQNKTDSNTHHHSDSNVIIDNENGGMFDVDWDTIEKNYRHRHRHHHSSNHNHKPNSDFATPSTKDDSKSVNSADRKWSKKKKIIIGILLFFLCVIIGLIGTFLVMRYLGHQRMLDYDNINLKLPEDIDYENSGRTVYYNGHTYQFNDNIASILFMGIDHNEFKDEAVPSTAGQADALYLMTYDTSNGKIKVLALNRDIMTDIRRYDGDGNYYDTATKQLCLAYAFGDGKQTSAQNQVVAVERLIYNIPINAYYAIDFSSLKILNDDIGGVTLTPEYTFKRFTKGQEITIKGDLAEEFVRYRDTSLLDDNLRRMSCQRLYINSFANQIVPAIKKDVFIPLKLYQDTSEYTVTNINSTIMTYLGSSLAMNYSGLNMITTEGTYKKVKGDESAEFDLDKDDFFKKILDIYYIQVD